MQMVTCHGKHISHICSNLSRAIAIIWKLRLLVSCKWASMLYSNIFFLPHISYCTSVWAACEKTRLKAIDILQDKALKNYPYSAHVNPFHRAILCSIHPKSYHYQTPTTSDSHVQNSPRNIAGWLQMMSQDFLSKYISQRLTHNEHEFYLPTFGLAISQLILLYR